MYTLHAFVHSLLMQYLCNASMLQILLGAWFKRDGCIEFACPPWACMGFLCVTKSSRVLHCLALQSDRKEKKRFDCERYLFVLSVHVLPVWVFFLLWLICHVIWWLWILCMCVHVCVCARVKLLRLNILFHKLQNHAATSSEVRLQLLPGFISQCVFRKQR